MATVLTRFSVDITDWLVSQDVSAMSAAEVGGLFLLRINAWLAEDCSLPADDSQLSRLSRLGDQWERVGSRLRAQFTESNGRLFDVRLASLKGRTMAAREGSKRGGMAAGKVRQKQAKMAQMILTPEPGITS
jgi:uncharacterized protein YdaU (DUF1376 family)